MKRLAGLLLAAAAVVQAAPIDDLTRAAEFDDARTVTALLLRGVDPSGRDARGRAALDVALAEDSLNALESLLAHAALDVNAANANDETPLMLAALKGRLAAVKKLAARGARVNKSGWTPLHYAASGPDEGVAAWLLAQGADINARSPNGSTPLMMAARYGTLDLPHLLLNAGADASLRNDLGLTALDFARSAGREDLVKKLSAMTAH